MPYLPIEHYGVIGNLRTAALVGANGSIDWLCLPHFDSPSVFGAILDDNRGGRFHLGPRDASCRSKQTYWPDTNVLVTRFYHEEGIAELIDFMPIPAGRPRQLVRTLRVTRGRLDFVAECRPAFDYARVGHEVELVAEGAIFTSAAGRLLLQTRSRLQRDGAAVCSAFSLHEDEEMTFVLHWLEKDARPPERCPERAETEDIFRGTVEFWRAWLRQCTYTGRWRETVQRSALALKLLTFEPTGAIVAAPTCSLPEAIGGHRNWDYRYTWIRDAAFTVYGMMRIGFTEEANAFMRWLDARIGDDEWDERGPLQIVYRLDGSCELPEEELPHLEGYRGSKPVRIGNGAASQFQLDIYGELFDAAYLANKYGAPLSAASWAKARRMIDWLAQHWRDDDHGIWEARAGKQPYTFSKLMCWVAFDRALRLADKRSFPADRTGWQKVRDEIYEAIMERGWSARRKAFVQAFDGEALDAANLLMPLVFFVAPNEPRMLSTIDAILQPKIRGGLRADGLIHRYDFEQARGESREKEGTFNLCTFWLVEALTRAGRTDPARLDEARLIFERMLGFANHLGLYAEETGFSGEALGNYPQAFTHLSLISAAFNLDRALDAKGK